MIGATAQGVRLSQSKLRYHMQDFSYGLFSLVQGKEVWRVVGAKEVEGVEEVKKENQKLYVQILTLLKRLLPGEEKNERLFDMLEKLHAYLFIMGVQDTETLEYITVLRMLDLLGYVSNKEIFLNILSTNDLHEKVLQEVSEAKDFIIKEINEGLKQSQL